MEGAATLTAPIVCTIGCSDPWNAAGIGVDLRALVDCGVRVVSVVAGITAQNRLGVSAAAAVESRMIAAQFDSLAGARIAAFRVGALLDPKSVKAVAERLAASALPVVYDPVLAASGDGVFADEETRAAIVACLIPVATVITPNLDEAEALSGIAPVRDRAAMERAGAAFVAAGARAALVKGGHLTDEAADVLVDGTGVRTFAAARFASDMRGTGCLLACGIAAALAHGATLPDAIESARTFVRARFVASVDAGGMRVAY